MLRLMELLLRDTVVLLLVRVLQHDLSVDIILLSIIDKFISLQPFIPTIFNRNVILTSGLLFC